MPRKNVPKAKKNYRKRKSSYKRKSKMPFRPQNLVRLGFPKTTMVRLRYVDFCTLDGGAGTCAQAIFKANGCFDPRTAIGGHQPMGFDQWSTFYNHYVVVGSKIRAHLGTGGVTPLNGAIFGINLNDDVTMSTDVTTIMEQGLSKFNKQNFHPSAGAGRGFVATSKFSAKKFFNITNVTDNINRIGSQTTADPTDLANYIVWFGAPPGDLTDMTSINATIIIEYLVVFSEPRDLAQS